MIQRILRQAEQRPIAVVLILSGLAGLCLGLSNSTYQVSVQSGQVLAGLVRYPPDNPFYLYHIKAFTIINQISAVLLYIIGSEKIVSIIISGLLGLVSFQAVSMLIFSVSRDVYFSVLGTLLVYFANLVGNGVTYEIHLLGMPNTYGILGLSFYVLTIALIAAGAYRSGLFLLGLALCVHASAGGWLLLTVCICALFDIGLAKKVLGRYYPYLMAGVAVTALSAAYQLNLIAHLPAPEADTQRQYLNAYIRYWDLHRQPLYSGFFQKEIHFPWGVIYGLESIIFCLIMILQPRQEHSVRFAFRTIFICGTLSLLSGILTHLLPESLPAFLLVLMPGRYININNIILVPSILGFLATAENKKYKTNHTVLIFLLAASLFSRHAEVLAPAVFAAVLWAAYLIWRKLHPAPDKPAIFTHAPRPGHKTLALVFLLLFLAINAPRAKYRNHFLHSREDFADYTNSDFYAAVSRGRGLLLITHYSPLISLRTRRPVLADMSSPNFFIYALESAPIYNSILKEVYGVDILCAPPPEWRHTEILSEFYHRLWQERPRVQWQQLALKFGFTDIVTPADWQLDLPVVAHAEAFVLYQIPPMAYE